jgi:hypothetical protein
MFDKCYCGLGRIRKHSVDFLSNNTPLLGRGYVMKRNMGHLRYSVSITTSDPMRSHAIAKFRQ